MSTSQATETTPRSGLDEPLSDPTNDLLDMNQHALALANYIREKQGQLPFTVGIFGEWGEGKTTMVRFLHHHLSELSREKKEPEIKFVTFSAWPFTTSEKLWRALILEIAKGLLNYRPKKDDAKNSDEEERAKNESHNWLTRVSNFLINPFFPAKKEPPPQDDYEKFVKRLEETDYGRISKRTPVNQVNQEAMMTAVVNATLTVLGSMSPLVSGLRALWSPRVDAGQLSKSQADESSTEAVEALPKFREIFKDLLNAQKEKGAVYVFVDDLDRAQPDVALDIMESIRIALTEVDCVFIIAIDEALISQGLRLRYKELFAEDKRAGASTALANKGGEYLEKIIQFRTRVPPRTAEQIKRLIAAEFPEWTPIGDIIQTIATTNPRRIKQYCQRLSFQKAVGSSFILGSTVEQPAAGQNLRPGTIDQAQGTVSSNVKPGGSP